MNYSSFAKNEAPRRLACEEACIAEVLPLGCCEAEGPRFAELHLLVSDPAWQGFLPGNFVMLRPILRNQQPVPLAWGHDLLWGRAFSICRSTRDADGKTRVVLFMQVVGRGTPALLGLQPGDKVLMWGPLGNAFAVEPDTPTLLLAGGLGVAPFVGYTQAHPNLANVRLEFGHRMPLPCYPLETLPQDLSFNTHLESNSQDLQNFIKLLEEQIADYAAKQAPGQTFGGRGGLVLACGPKPFLKTVYDLALRFKARAQLSLETQMACGSGVCLGCTVKAAKEFGPVPLPEWPVQVCLQGPIFWANEIILD